MTRWKRRVHSPSRTPTSRTAKDKPISRRLLLRSMAGLSLVSIAQVRAASSSANDVIYRHNPSLESIDKDMAGSPYKDGIFLNWDLTPGGSPMTDVLKWKLTPNPQAEQKSNEHYQVPVMKNAELLDDRERDFICWLGHASFLIQMGGKRFLTDPCLTAPPLMKRLSELPFPIEAIEPDFLLISHGHYDHLDSDTLKTFKRGTALVPLDMEPLIKDINPNLTVQEAGWNQYYQIDGPFKISFLPAYHWYRRSLLDKNTQLWGSFVLQYKNTTVYFAGDSAYAPHFETIGKRFPDIDYALLPIGAYEPRWMMKNSHMNPIEALQAHEDLGARELIPMHYGTFDLTDEPMSEPEALLKKAAAHHQLRIPAIGEPIWV